MTHEAQARVYEVLACLLRATDREAVIHRLLGACLCGPDGFGVLLPHLPDDLVAARCRLSGKRRVPDLDRAADALVVAAFAARHAPGCGDRGCACHAILREGIPAFLTRSAGPLAVRLCAARDPYYQHLGELLARNLQANAGPEADDAVCSCSSEPALSGTLAAHAAEAR